jgi:hypothetical protein
MMCTDEVAHNVSTANAQEFVNLSDQGKFVPGADFD